MFSFQSEGTPIFRPTQDYILVKPIERVKSSIIEVVMTEKPNTGEVIAVGQGRENKHGKFIPLDVKKGDRIRFGTDQNYLTFPEYHEAGERYVILQEADVCWIEGST